MCVLLLCACGAGNGNNPPETTAANQSPSEATEPPVETTEPPVEEDENFVRTETPGSVISRIYPEWFQPTGEESDYMRDMLTRVFAEPNRWYSRALDSLYVTPADVDLDAFLLGGVWQQSRELTETEKELLKAHFGEDSVENLDFTRLTSGQIETVLEAFFGIGLEETNQVGMTAWYYLPETDCYYRCGGGASGSFVTIHSVYEQEDGTYHVYYSDTPEDGGKLSPDYLLILEPYVKDFDRRFRILANVDTREYFQGNAQSYRSRLYPNAE